MDPSRLANHQDLTFTALSDQKRVQLPELQQIAEICNLAELWTQGILRPYQKIEAICQQLRENYTLDRSARVPDDCEFPVGHFLFESKRGPDYQFATAATLMLRSLGFSTRLVSGFYADPKRHDPRKQQTAVHSSDVHFRCEVYVGAETWVTLDPTPGYEVLSPPPGLLKRVTMLMLATAQRIMKHWVIASIILFTLSAAVVKRRLVADRCNVVLWRFARAKTARGRVLQTARLLDHRLRLAGLPRPSGMTLTKWLRGHSELQTMSPTMSEFLSLADRAAYGSESDSSSASFALLEQCCQRVQRELTLTGLQRTVLSRRKARPDRQSTPLFSEVAFS